MANFKTDPMDPQDAAPESPFSFYNVLGVGVTFLAVLAIGYAARGLKQQADLIAEMSDQSYTAPKKPPQAQEEPKSLSICTFDFDTGQQQTVIESMTNPVTITFDAFNINHLVGTVGEDRVELVFIPKNKPEPIATIKIGEGLTQRTVTDQLEALKLLDRTGVVLFSHWVNCTSQYDFLRKKSYNEARRLVRDMAEHYIQTPRVQAFNAAQLLHGRERGGI